MVFAFSIVLRYYRVALLRALRVHFMIRNFKCKETEKLFNGYYAKKLPKDIQRIAQRKLKQLDFAYHLTDLRIAPGNKLEALKKDRLGQYSIRINDQWRICFKWNLNSAYDVEIVDYH